VTALCLSLLALLFVGPPQPQAEGGPRPHHARDAAIDFTLTERSGRKVTSDDLAGKVWIASFIVTRCPDGKCPQVTQTMKRLQSELANRRDVVLVTFTVDPKDDPGELSRYADAHGADPDRWLFLTGLLEPELHKLLKDGFKVTAQRSASPKPGDEFDHSSRLAVVDKQGNIRGYYDGIRPATASDAAAEFDENLNRLKSKVAELLRE
jgi:protein SCO1